jgi:MAF protein
MNLKRPLILASSSPRRRFLMSEIGFQFTVAAPDIDESFSSEMDVELVPSYLSHKKANVFRESIADEIVVASDTVVILGDHILNKPEDREDAIRMISMLNGTTHLVITSVTILDKNKTETFDERTYVTFNHLSPSEIATYIDTFKPFDKAGAYGAQECLAPGINPCSKEEIDFLNELGKQSLIEKSIVDNRSENRVSIIEKIEGSYFNVMGLPIHKVYQNLMRFSQ